MDFITRSNYQLIERNEWVIKGSRNIKQIYFRNRRY
jgi:hypothetical protein